MKTNVVLAIIAAGLAVPTTITVIRDRTSFTEYDKIPRLFEGFTADSIRYVVLTKVKREKEGDEPVKDAEGKPVEESLVLVRENDEWKIGDGELAGVPAQTSKIETDVLDHLKRIRVDPQALIRSNATDQELVERSLTPETGIVIHALDAQQKPMAQLVIGKDASGGKWGEEVVKGFFVRRLDNNSRDIVLYDAQEAQYWGSQLTLKADDWINKKIHEFDVARATSFRVQNPKGTVEFEKAKAESGGVGEWRMKSGPDGVGAVRQQEVANLLQRFASPYAVRYVKSLDAVGNDLGEYGLHTPEVEVSATTDDGTVYTLAIGKKIEGTQEYFARSNHTKFVLAIGDWDRTTYFDKDPKDLFDPPASAIGGAPAASQGTAPTTQKDAPTEPATQPGDGK